MRIRNSLRTKADLLHRTTKSDASEVGTQNLRTSDGKCCASSLAGIYGAACPSGSHVEASKSSLRMALHRCYDLIAHDIHANIPTFTVLDEFLDDKMVCSPRSAMDLSSDITHPLFRSIYLFPKRTVCFLNDKRIPKLNADLDKSISILSPFPIPSYVKGEI